MYEIQKFDGQSVAVKAEHSAAIAGILLKTGKFIEVSGVLINIADIRAFGKKEKSKLSPDELLAKYNKL